MSLELAEKISEVPKLYVEGNKSTARCSRMPAFPRNGMP
jgi:hypothetical protein